MTVENRPVSVPISDVEILLRLQREVYELEEERKRAWNVYYTPRPDGWKPEQRDAAFAVGNKRQEAICQLEALKAQYGLS